MLFHNQNKKWSFYDPTQIALAQRFNYDSQPSGKQACKTVCTLHLFIPRYYEPYDLQPE